MLRIASVLAACAYGLAFLGLVLQAGAEDEPRLKLAKGDKVVLVGNALAERMDQFGHFETLLHSRFPELELTVRNLGWSADEVTLRPRSKDFQDHGHTLRDHAPQVILAFFGFNESFAGPAGVSRFEADLEGFLDMPAYLDQFSTSRIDWEQRRRREAEGKLPSLRQIVLISPIAHENIQRPGYPDGSKTNENLKLYTEAMARVAKKKGVPFIDLFTASQDAMEAAQIGQSTTDGKHLPPIGNLTINGIHLSERGDWWIAHILDKALFGLRPENKADVERLRAEVLEKNRQFFYDYRAVNGFYIYGGRKHPFGVVNFPAEFAKLRNMTAQRDARIWTVARGESVPAKVDDSGTGEFAEIESNFDRPINILPGEEAAKTFTTAEGYQVNLFASEKEFPDLQNPVSFGFDNRGRLWVSTIPSYPQYVPGVPPSDKLLILEDTDGDGRADKQTVFADGLYLPCGFEFWDGGVIVAAQPNLLFLKDTDGDDKADVREVILHGFDSADSHHAISAFTFDPGGALYFQEGTFHHTQVETPYGPERCANAGVFRYEPRTGKFRTFVSYGFANPWGHIFDGWGQNFVADASGGANYFGTAFSGDVDFPHKHGNLKQFLEKQWRPTCGCELVSSRHFPPEAQGNYLLNNCIGFQGVLQYKMKDEGSGFAADPLDPLLSSSDPNFRPTDIEFGPDGSLFICDWFNPLVGHMQHSVRDPKRDHTHGRIWRISHKDRPLVTPPKIAGASVPALLQLLTTEPEERTRYRVRSELWARPTAEVLSEVNKWLASIDNGDPQLEHHKLEALWLHQAHDTVNESLLKAVLASPDFRARAAATRVLGYWRDRVDQPLELLRNQVTDEHPRVRLEAVRALSFFGSQDAIDVAVESLVFDQDDYLKYTFNETMKTLERRVKGETSIPHEGTDWDKRNAEGYAVPSAGKAKGSKSKGGKAKAGGVAQ